MKLLGPTLLILGAILNILALFMLVPLALSITYNSDNQLAFFSSATITSLAGIAFLLVGKKSRLDFMQPRQVFLITTTAWTGVSLFSALPFLLIDHPLNIADAVFEAVSGVTSTGSSVMAGLDALPKDILLWRSMLNWIGGVGIIGMAIAILPFLRVGGMRLFKTESSDWSDKAMPRAQSLMAMIIYCYIALSVICCLAFWLAGMDFFNAVNHAMATVSTGGFSTSDSSFAQFESLLIHWVAIVFMLAGAFPFVLFVRLLINRKFIFLKDTQVRGLLWIVAVTTFILTAQLILTDQMDPFRALTMACFNLVSVITTTGFASGDYQLWGPLALIVFFFVTFVGGCSGSTTGGIKVFRLQIFGGLVKEQIMTAIHPRAIISRRYNNRLISSEIIASSISYMFLMVTCLVVIAIILALTGLDLVTSFTGAATSVMNVGPGLGPIIGPAGNFSSLSDTAKWALSAGMLLGRLEFLTILVLFFSSILARLMNIEQILRKFAYPIGILFPWLLTPIAFLITDYLPKANVPLLYIVMVVFIAINVTVELAIINALSSFFAFSFFFAEPYGSIMIHQDEDLLTILVFLLTSVLVGYMATKHKRNVQKIRVREFMTDIELELLEKLPKAINTEDVIAAMRDALKPWHENCVLITHGDNWATHPMIRRLTNLRKTYLEELLELRLTPEVIEKIPQLEQEHDVYFLYNSRQVIGLLRISTENIQHLPKDIFLLLLHQVNISLERTRLAADLEKEKIAKENEALRSALLSSVSHDFRTPLTTMIGATSTVIEFGEYLDKQQTRELLDTVLEEAQRLNRYTQNLLDMTRLGFGQLLLECDWVSVEEIMSVVKKRLKPLLIHNYLREGIDPNLPSLYVHAALLEQAIFNVIDNAIKFSPANASIDIECTKEDDNIVITICDHGTGIPEDEREKVFERFHTAEKGDRRRSGSGLGLTICQGMIMAHGGKVSIHANPSRVGDRENPGCCVRIELPINNQQERQDLPKSEE